MRPRRGPWPTSSCNPPSNSRAWGLEPAAARASCGRVHRRKPRMQPQPGAQDREREDERCFSWNPVTPSDARDGSLVPLGRAQAPIPRHLTVSRSRAQAPCDFTRAISKMGCSKTANQRRAVGSPFASAPRNTVVSKWYPQLSQVHKCRTHRSFTCSDQSGAINISPHCAQGLKYLGWAGRGLVAVSRDISKPPKIAAPVLRDPSCSLWRRHDYVDRIKLFESDKWPKLPQNVAARQVPHQHRDDTETKYTITRRLRVDRRFRSRSDKWPLQPV
jgi:hypothetical protein